MKNSNIAINADDHYHDNRGCLKDVLEWKNYMRIQMKIEGAVKNKLSIRLCVDVNDGYEFVQNKEKEIGGIEKSQNHEKSVKC